MTRRPFKPLSDEDRVLWSLVARTAVPLKPVRRDPVVAPTAPRDPVVVPTPEPAPAVISRPAMPAYYPPVSSPRRAPGLGLDAPTHAKLARGRTPLEARVDLHGMFQDEAYALLLSFLRRAHTAGARHVLVITGKGSSSGGDGVLRRSVPGWLATPPFREHVSGFDPAARSHGGTGALYVRLKRPA